MSEKQFIVSNRLPVNIKSGDTHHKVSSGGLVSAIQGIRSKQEIRWIGCTHWDFPPLSANGFRLIPAPIPEKVYDLYYNGICNNVLWPLLHYEADLIRFHPENWKAYEAVNNMMADRIVSHAESKDLIWIHDYHFFLLPKLLKKRNKKLRVGFFLHVPFCSSEVFRQLPVREEILDGLLYADLVGFHDYDYLRHFAASIRMVLGKDTELHSVQYQNHTAHLGVFPVSINTPAFFKKAAAPKTQKLARKYRKNFGKIKIILGVERLDYTKGVELKLQSFRKLLQENPSLRGKVKLLQVAVPTRTRVDDYRSLRQEIEQLVGQINGEFSMHNYAPVEYTYRSLKKEELLALYRIADCLLITSKRDGMNLVSLEYVASQNPKNPGVICLSEFTGASSMLSHALSINPWNIEDTCSKIKTALKMSLTERRERHGPMLHHLQQYTASNWAGSFMKTLTKVSQDKLRLPQATRDLTPARQKRLNHKIKQQKTILFIDYDGTLASIQETPEKAVLDKKEKEILARLTHQNNLQIVAVSGRPAEFLEKQLKPFDIEMAAEHGSRFFDPRKGTWRNLIRSNKKDWSEAALCLMDDYTRRVPESFIEKKAFAISWHYRKSPPLFADYQARRLRQELEMGLANLPVVVLHGKKVVEVRSIDANKGLFIQWYLERLEQHSPLVIAVGDDTTDEDMFKAVEGIGVSIRVGMEPTAAQYRIPDRKTLLKFLAGSY